jgi:thioredoxin reductase (NADPH)
MERFDVIVIGQGYAGLTAAKIAVERGLRTANFEVECMGGLVLNINELDPPPPGEEHSGADLASNLLTNNLENGVVAVSEEVTAVERIDGGLWAVKTEAETYVASDVVVASGGRQRKLGVPGEEEFFGRGVSGCADCDGPLFDGMETVIVGGGDSAFQEALALSQFASKVTLLMRGTAPRARPDLVERVAANAKIVQLANSRVMEIVGNSEKGVEGVRLETAGEGERTIACAGVFVFIGLEPNTRFLPPEISRDSSGGLITSDHCATALPGLWAVGAVRSGCGGLLTDAAADAERALAALAG